MDRFWALNSIAWQKLEVHCMLWLFDKHLWTWTNSLKNRTMLNETQYLNHAKLFWFIVYLLLLLFPWNMPLLLAVSLLMVNTPLLLTRCKFSIFLIASDCIDCFGPWVDWLELLHCLPFSCLVLSVGVFVEYRVPFSLGQLSKDGGSDFLNLNNIKKLIRVKL